MIVARRGRPIAAIVPLDDLARLEGQSVRGVLAFVGAFADAKKLPRILDDAVRTRGGQRPRAAAKLPVR